MFKGTVLAATEGLGALEYGFIALVSLMSILAGLFAVYAFIQIFRNPSRRR